MLLIAMMTQHKQNEIIIFVSHSHVKGPAADERLGIMRWCSQGILNGEVSLYHRPPVCFGISRMATDNFCFYLQNRLIQIFVFICKTD